MRFQQLDERIRLAVDEVAATDPNPADPFRGLYITDDLARSLAHASPIDAIDGRLEAAAGLLGLDPLDTGILAVCAAPELSPRYARLLAYLHDDVTRKLASPRLAARLLAGQDRDRDTILARFAHDARLRGTGAIRLLDGENTSPLADRLVKVADPLAAFLLGVRLDDAEWHARARRIDLDPALEPGLDQEAIEDLKRVLSFDSNLSIVIYGPDATFVLAAALQRGILTLELDAARERGAVSDATLSALLEGRTLCFEQHEAQLQSPSDSPEIVRALSTRCAGTLVCTPSDEVALSLADHGFTVVRSAALDFRGRMKAWQVLSGETNPSDVAAKFRLSVAQIARASAAARVMAAARGALRPSGNDLLAGAKQASVTRLRELASHLRTPCSWDDLVLPARQIETLRSISSYLRHRDLVLSEWGYGRIAASSQGLKVLFAGDSGTGKTLAAQVLAHGLGLDLFRIDLATIVSKYIGETEKNLDRVFDAAQDSNAILFFDEADALFGKRSDVSDAHDRYANIEVAYLLQKMDSYAGAVVLATNFRHNIDDAFLRRLDFLIDFPFPEADDRRRIWSLLVPAQAPVAGDLDLTFLAEQFKLSGGSIRNCALAAAFLAADDGGAITMNHLVRAVALEYGKLGRLTLESDFERFHEGIRLGAL